ncbi:MAG: hypothetical protein A2538_01545 [Candidatus Magasanikbacteria bacterium RIFOXYD2_FULL_41_14]|uniref:Uncharacterized protein n=1 Tax=Candidatus Magasanikbacteria bacterium RIFOXYD2_FULL_41_14 TaxID=1798709 RepID=A0A1F6PDF1_9BACT|nr:MAG: hypothetical protein A2538_01545 [Candidatus Magasanikbacteria bacterium RIFOXYD2_FULL_41_14]
MFGNLQYIVFFGAIVHLCGTFFYLRNTLRGVTKPNRVSFLMWGIAPLISTAAAILAGVGWAILPTFLAGFGPLIIFVASFANKNAYWKLGFFDYICGLLSASALVLWVVTNNPLLAILFALLSDVAAAIPTLIKSWNFPETETAVSYVTSGFSAFTGFFAVQRGDISEYIFGLYIITMNIIILSFLYRKKIAAKFVKL